MHLVGIFIRIYHDARFSEPQIHLQYTGIRVTHIPPPPLFFAQYMIKGKGCNTPIQATSAALTLCNTVAHIEIRNYACYMLLYIAGKSDVWLTVHRNSVWVRKTN